MLLDKASWVDDVKTRLGYPVLSLSITDEMIGKQVDYSLKKILPYLNSVEIFEVRGKRIEFTDKIVYSVFRVTSARKSADAYQNGGDMYSSQFIQVGKNSQGLIHTQIWNQYAQEVNYAFASVGFKLVGNVLYIDGGTPPYTVEAITDSSVQNMTEDLVNWCFEYSLALTKLIEGEIRSKVKVVGSPVDTNGEALKEEGKTERDALEEKLGSSISLYYATR